MKTNPCSHHLICGACSLWDLPYQEQLKNKVQDFQYRAKQNQLPISQQIPIYHLDTSDIRDRMDFKIIDGKIGLYDKSVQFLVEVPNCRICNEKIRQLYLKLQSLSWPIKKGSLRIRANPSGQMGLWLDFANLDIKNLFAEKSILTQLQSLCFTEVGQRKKSLHYEEGRFKLKEPQLFNWTRTWRDNQPIELYGPVGGFSQAGDLINKKIITQFDDYLKHCTNIQTVLEYGCGNGNLTFPAANGQRHFYLLETDPLAIEGFKTTADKYQFKDQFHFIKNWDQKPDLIVANPPRSGLSIFLKSLNEKKCLPQHFIYMSCHKDTFFKDAKELQKMGLSLKKVSLIDQFPYTDHYEILSLWDA